MSRHRRFKTITIWYRAVPYTLDLERWALGLAIDEVAQLLDDGGTGDWGGPTGMVVRRRPVPDDGRSGAARTIEAGV